MCERGEPGDRYGDVVARLLQEQKKHDYFSYLTNVVKKGDSVKLDCDEVNDQ